jgi:hypothetical protein
VALAKGCGPEVNYFTLKGFDWELSAVNDRPGFDYRKASDRVFSFIHTPNLLRPPLITQLKASGLHNAEELNAGFHRSHLGTWSQN